MKKFPEKLQEKLSNRKANNALRQLSSRNDLIDFSSNDYLGFSKSESIFNTTHDFLIGHNIKQNGATGSRLLSGNYQLFNIVETILANFHNSETALIFNSGYDANVGFFSCVPQRDDVILYDEFIHASIRDGIKLSNAKAYKFKHNDLDNLDEMLNRVQYDGNIYIVTESVFSMDGDSPDLAAICKISKKHDAFLIVDEAHAVGVFGKRGIGLIPKLNLENHIFARLVTFGKAIGCHGAAIICSENLKQYLVNFSRSFIYTTALPPHSLATIHSAYTELISTKNIEKLHKNIKYFKAEVIKHNLQNHFIKSDSAIHCCIISGNEKVKQIAKKLQQHNFSVKPILSPTVKKEEERLRFCLHSYNSEKETTEVLQLLSTFL
ncbi:pyridoxal phosphate-dependent aminotransferase family protein [Sabulilitoribacter arenilitoris]|uniref:Pyridoxal phosphate-dependent aminotransferase family protein n=1 Tax=Wocania arenilitoris TaxID=2044858 RepID=A0AAE3ELZ4_9FLAO|nr:pyridoxal phosphate-dependent aminotransferase family protein [Wocania arenilitoris]MCF7566882.1 pyridoxal phosphate-dependent aminotransferase family protein [Wocania arenilitoris]